MLYMSMLLIQGSGRLQLHAVTDIECCLRTRLWLERQSYPDERTFEISEYWLQPEILARAVNMDITTIQVPLVNFLITIWIG